MNAARLMLALVPAAAITIGLLLLMSSLIGADVNLPADDEERLVADIVMPERKIETRYEAQMPDKPEAVPPPPQMPEPMFDDFESDTLALNLNMSAPRLKPALDIKGVGGFSTDGEYLPIVKVQPVYPRRALSRGIEGYVIVEFTVTSNGSVRDPVIVEADPKNVFDRAALKAVAKFKYKPRVIDGSPVEVPGVRNKISFQIAD